MALDRLAREDDAVGGGLSPSIHAANRDRQIEAGLSAGIVKCIVHGESAGFLVQLQ